MARTMKTARKTIKMTKKRRIKSRFAGFSGGTHRDKLIGMKNDVDHLPLSDFLYKTFQDNEPIAQTLLKTLQSNYISNLLQLLPLNEGDFRELSIPLGIKKRLVEGLEEYCREKISSMNALDDNEFFFVEREGEDIFIVIVSGDLKIELRNHIPCEELYSPRPRLNAMMLLRLISSLQTQGLAYMPEDKKVEEKITNLFKNVNQQNNGNWNAHQMGGTSMENEFVEEDPMHNLLRFLYSEIEHLIERLEAMVARGEITFHTLWYIFGKETKVVTTDTATQKHLEGFEVHSSSYSSGYNSAFSLNLRHIVCNGKFFAFANVSRPISEFQGVKAINSLKCMPLVKGSTVEEKLNTRGKRYATLAIGHHYLEYTGNMIRTQFWSTIDENATGRVMVDIAANNKMGSQDSKSRSSAFGGMNLSQAMSGQNNLFEVLPEDKYYMTPCTIAGFSFMNKRWGDLLVDGCEEISFESTAFDMLVLDGHKKQVVQALVEHSDKAFSDFVANKGKGCIFLLHGPPGVGKTLTAEAIAEYLHRPLYAVSVGELGTRPDQLEQNLSEILELAGIWNAVVLVDEADIFLERRSESDIIRNAMVGVFLRVVEYFHGVLFMTSNRVRALDRAFHSRVSVALKYPELNAKSRITIWDHFLTVCGMKIDESINLSKLGEFDLNGRQIRSTIRLAASLALNENKDAPVLKSSHIDTCISISNNFNDFAASSAIANMSITATTN